jgi:hypothetical protein
MHVKRLTLYMQSVHDVGIFARLEKINIRDLRVQI